MAFCGQCGSAVAEGHAFCPGCGTRVGSQPVANSRAAVAAAPALEKTFYQDERVLITNSRCIIAGQTYAMSGITSVRSFMEVPPKGGPILLVVVGVLFVLGSLPRLPDAVIGLLLGVGMIAGGIAWYKSRKNIYHVVFHSASGESKPIQSLDETYITGIIAALNDAIVYRS